MAIRETAWILGAGFSRPLGAPLFRDLFRNNHRVAAAYHGSGLPQEMERALRLYREHADLSPGPGEERGGVFWHDPEEFLDAIESAEPGTAAAGLLRTVGLTAPRYTVEMAKRALAIECAHFLHGANVDAERWLPYRMWADRLGRHDTVVTFNYDRVPDLLAHRGENPPVPGKYGRLKVIVPNQFAQGHINSSRQDGIPVVLKLHGSVDWYMTESGVVVDDSPDLPISANGANLVMAVPGPGKHGMRRRPEMGTLWDAAIAAIKTAHRVIFVGYRFPPTDAQARTELLEAVGFGADKAYKIVKIILGPDDRHPDVVRMRSLLDYVISSSLVQVIPLFAEDFLSLER